MTTNDIVLKLKLASNWLMTLLKSAIETLAKIQPQSLASMVLALLLWSILITAVLLVMSVTSGCASRPPPIVQPHKQLPPPPDFLMANPPTADLIPPEQQGKSARKSK